jgi:hypothetical protein
LAAVASTTTVTVTVPPVGTVTLPLTLVPLAVNAVGTVAPPPVVLLTCVAVRLLGSVSTMLAVVSVLGPALPITIVKLVVPPTAIVVLAAVLVRLGVTCTVAVPGAVAVLLPRFVTPASGVSVTVFV